MTSFDEIQAEASRLLALSSYRIKKIDVEPIINLYCAFAKWIGNQLELYAKKYDYNCTAYRLERLYYKIGYCHGKVVSIALNCLFDYSSEKNIKEILLHELAHTIFPNHEPEFWQQLVGTLNGENLLDENNKNHVFEIRINENGERELYDNGIAVSQFTSSGNMRGGWSLTHSYEQLRSQRDPERWLSHDDRAMRALMSRVIDAKGERRMEDKCHQSSLSPIWNDFLERYGLYEITPMFCEPRPTSICHIPLVRKLS